MPEYKDYGYKTIHVKHDLWLLLNKLKLMLGQKSIDSTLRIVVREWYSYIYMPRIRAKQPEQVDK